MQHKNITSVKQGNLKFLLLQPLSSERFREACSFWLRGDYRTNGIDAEAIKRLFNHDADNRPANRLSPFRFEGGACHGQSHQAKVIALGEESTHLLSRVGIAIGKAPFPTPWVSPPQWSETVAAARVTEGLVSYWSPQLVICRNAEQFQTWKSATLLSKAAHIEDIILRGVKKQIAMMGSESEPDVKHFKIHDVASITHTERAVPKLRNANTHANAFVRIASVKFEMELELRGHWAAGALINRGYGQILPLRDFFPIHHEKK